MGSGECVSVGNAYQFEMRISGECVSVRNANQVENADQPGGNLYQSGVWIRALSMSSTFGAPLPPTGNGNLTEFFFRENNGKKREKYTLFNFQSCKKNINQKFELLSIFGCFF